MANGSDDGKKDALAVTVDVDRYAHLLADSDASDEDKEAFLQALWEIICGFVALGYGVHPVQQAENTCGKIPETPDNQPLSGPNGLQLKDQTKQQNQKRRKHV